LTEVLKRGGNNRKLTDRNLGRLKPEEWIHL